MGEGKQGEGGDGKETSLFKGGGIEIIKARCITGYLLMALGMVTLGTPCAATLKGTQGQVMEAHSLWQELLSCCLHLPPLPHTCEP